MSLVLFLDVCSVPGFGASEELRGSEPHGRLLRNTTHDESSSIYASLSLSLSFTHTHYNAKQHGRNDKQTHSSVTQRAVLHLYKMTLKPSAL